MLKRHVVAVVAGMTALAAPVASLASEDLITLQSVPPIVFEDTGFFWRSVVVPLPPVRPASFETQKAQPRRVVAVKDVSNKEKAEPVRVALPAKQAGSRPFWMTVGTGF